MFLRPDTREPQLMVRELIEINPLILRPDIDSCWDMTTQAEQGFISLRPGKSVEDEAPAYFQDMCLTSPPSNSVSLVRRRTEGRFGGGWVHSRLGLANGTTTLRFGDVQSIMRPSGRVPTWLEMLRINGVIAPTLDEERNQIETMPVLGFEEMVDRADSIGLESQEPESTLALVIFFAYVVWLLSVIQKPDHCLSGWTDK
ncbi:uncharacterized protein MYCFIDRAFT_198818 [Pseudocercospora fijiensis CIRAD86]|uniref:Uncharacterized protein n=1 Tax=Pseudocercospora fijiensis (strain CIRAD86) TaxID=383855 RepID=M3AU23_PSEFD|nr:uncharacterized protein MYCFIDRAFT_198818 [Pseudocercospora fijiensis CIRAD86]EME80648.1 hypothetical protein MYCFIDRAFT_198818 [Pseudocercospora fijiensis CIRAD86]